MFALRFQKHLISVSSNPAAGQSEGFSARLFSARLFTARLFSARLFTARLFTARLFTARLGSCRFFVAAFRRRDSAGDWRGVRPSQTSPQGRWFQNRFDLGEHLSKAVFDRSVNRHPVNRALSSAIGRRHRLAA
jgi:hypothetical protein